MCDALFTSVFCVYRLFVSGLAVGHGARFVYGWGLVFGSQRMLFMGLTRAQYWYSGAIVGEMFTHPTIFR